jgi:hypothetical protein
MSQRFCCGGSLIFKQSSIWAWSCRFRRGANRLADLEIDEAGRERVDHGRAGRNADGLWGGGAQPEG